MSGMRQSPVSSVPQLPLSAEYQFKTATIIDHHVSQVAIDGGGEYSVATTGNPLLLAKKLREIADHIEHMENQK